ncbi:MAG: 3-deoxy-D-manno-octulosonic acid kinase [Proteobacteria bacterium]|jgi:3-deoxy-D-manno-octulosonic acid kinase|nr:3-deoxy-D-manno-octulosonic acid kinase [Pseudomonadota bacterium]MCG6935593.1 3-deoxy-D-manno-octulosonic acid kinase [Pseudomonadota bacterium]
MKAIEINRGQRHILYDAELIENPDRLGFHPDDWAAQSAIIGFAEGRGTTFFVQYEGRDYVLRHYRRGGMITRFSADRYVWTGLHRTRAWREWQLLAKLYAQGLPVPRPVAAQVVRYGPTYSADIMTQRITGTVTLAEHLARQPLDPQMWAGLGRLIRQFHQHGVFHADLNAHNILLDPQDQMYLIDFDRGRIRKPSSPWQQANLARLRRSLDKLQARAPEFHFCEPDWQTLRSAYARPDSNTGNTDSSLSR